LFIFHLVFVVYLSIVNFQLENLMLFVVFSYTKQYTLYMIAFSYKRLIDQILLPLFGGSLFFLLLLTPLIYYSFAPSFHAEYMAHKWLVMSDSSFGHVQNVYMFIQGRSFLDQDFSLAEKSHMEDVKWLFGLAYFIEIIAVVVFLSVLLVFVFQRKMRLIVTWLFRGSLISLILFFLLFAFLFIDFAATFNLFHALFFPQGNWSFDSSSMLISLFSASFFEAIATRVFIVGVCISLLVFCCTVMWRKVWTIQKQ